MKKLHQDVYIGLVMVLAFLWATAEGLQIQGEPGVVPVALSAILLAFGIYVLVDGVVKTKKAEGEMKYTLSWAKIDVSVIAYLGVALYIAVFYLLGYFTATFLFLTAMMQFLKVGSLKKTLIIAIATDVCLYILFVVLFGVNVAKIGCLI